MPADELPILMRDRRFVVLNKPAGLPVHAGPRAGKTVESWFPRLAAGRDGPWLVHRLDTDTAGCLVIALRRSALRAAQAAFAAGLAEKTYWAVVRGRPRQDSGLIDAPLGKLSTPAGWRMRVDPAGRPAATAWRLRGAADGLSWLELRPRTGRTHQVRVHCAALGCPVLGDALYDGGNGPMHLLARAIRLSLTPPLAACAPPPVAMHDALRRCGWSAIAEGVDHAIAQTG